MHDIEADVSVKELKGGTVPYYQTVFDACFEHVKGGIVFWDYLQKKIGIWTVCFIIRAGEKFIEQTAAFCYDKLT